MNEPRTPRSPEDREAERTRERQTLLGGAAALILVGIITWTFYAMDRARKIEECLEAGHRNCLPSADPSR